MKDFTDLTKMRTKGSLDLKCMRKTDRGEKTIGKYLNRLGRFAYEFAKFLTEIGSKVSEVLIYNKATNNPVYRNK